MVSSILTRHALSFRYSLSAFSAPVLLGLLLLGGCAATDADIQAQLPRTADAESLYNYGIDALHNGRYKLASGEFELLQQNYPYSGYTGNAELMEGYAYYLQGEYALSVQQLERYLQLHPTSPDAAYAYYLRGLCYYEQIGDVSRDQLGTLQSMDALQEVVTRFPQTSYARDAQLKIDLCRDHLAGKEMYVGRYYQREKDYQASYARYQRVIQDFQTTNHVPEALERLVELNLNLGMPDEARQTAAVLGYNAPDSSWYREAYRRLKRTHQLVPQLQRPAHPQIQPKSIPVAKPQNASHAASLLGGQDATTSEPIASITIPPVAPPSLTKGEPPKPKHHGSF